MLFYFASKTYKLTVLPDGQEGLLVVVGGHVENKHVEASDGGGEDASIGVHTATSVD